MKAEKHNEFSFIFGSNILTVKTIKTFPVKNDLCYVMKVSTKDPAVPCYSMADFDGEEGQEGEEYTEVNTGFSLDDIAF